MKFRQCSCKDDPRQTWCGAYLPRAYGDSPCVYRNESGECTYKGDMTLHNRHKMRLTSEWAAKNKADC